jgi:hypothetical protein
MANRFIFLTIEFLLLLILASGSYTYVVAPKESSNDEGTMVYFEDFVE